MQPIPVEEPEDQFLVTRSPKPNLSVYSELVSTLPLIQEDFFRTPLTEDEQTDAIYSRPRSMKKIVTTLYGIQVALAQATRPDDDYVQHRIHETTEVTPDDTHIFFDSMVRVLYAAIIDTAPAVQQDLDQPRGLSDSGGGICLTHIKNSHPGSSYQGSWAVQPPLLNTKLIDLGYKIKLEKIDNDPDSINHTLRNGDKLVRDDNQGITFLDQGPQMRNLENHEGRDCDF
ncbi:hypothetical protein AYI69_g6059 [Smittium culicis]|uniref:Uncharacterized protein n=1 Tax=Smittium culicis TaxID=133412 RepID=A0A1R1Y204_9FUNG|nr:hypothetical protein AYI69_g6059 [Smittium culicis]